MFLLHVDTEPVHEVMEGRLLTLLPNEPFEVKEIVSTDVDLNGNKTFVIPSEFIARVIIAHQMHHGVVLVKEIRRGYNTELDVKSARAEAAIALKAGQDKMLSEYVRIQLEDRLKENKPALPPSKPIERIIDERGIDLQKEYGFRPVGWRVGDETKAREERTAALEAENVELKRTLRLVMEKVDRLALDKETAGTAKKG